MNPEPLFDWINERHAIYQRRAFGEAPPWTVDPELLKYKFCNVFRELDTVTIWIRENIRKPYADHPDLWLMLALGRYVNLPEALAEVIKPEFWPEGNPMFEKMTEALEARRAKKLQTETGAYMIRAEANPNAPWYKWSKQRYIVEIVVGGMWGRRAELMWDLGLSIEAATRGLMKSYGAGGFMAYEIATDLRWCPKWLTDAPDIMTWAHPGPGAYRGLNRLHGRVSAHSSIDVAVGEMRELLDLAPLYLARHVPMLEMRDVEHSLCETDKWLRAKEGGRPRSMFKPRRAA